MDIKEVILYKDGRERDFYVVFLKEDTRHYENRPIGAKDHLVRISQNEIERILLPEIFGKNGEGSELWIINYVD